MSNCVHLVYEAGHFPGALDLCASLQDGSGLSCVLFCPYYLPETERYRELARERGLCYVHEATALGGDADFMRQLGQTGRPASAPVGSAALPAGRRSWFDRIRQRCASYLLRHRAPECRQHENHYRARASVAERFLSATQASTLLLPEDNVERDSACWIAAIHARGGKAVVVSYSSITPHEAAVTYFDHPDHRVANPADEWFVKLYPKWKTRYRDRTMVRLPLARALAMETLGIAPRQPWFVNSGAADVVAVESQFMRQHYIEHGFAPEKVLATGNLPLDTLAQAAASRADRLLGLAKSASWKPGKKLLLCALPPNQYPRVRAGEFQDYETLIRSWISLLKAVSHQFNVTVTPHPSIAREHLEAIERAGLSWVPQGAAHWIPLCDLYVASVSSTIKWALACGSPVLNYDCYGYGYSDYSAIPQVIHARSHQEAQSALDGLCDDHTFHELAQRAMAGRLFYGTLDGKSGARLAAIVKS